MKFNNAREITQINISTIPFSNIQLEKFVSRKFSTLGSKPGHVVFCFFSICNLMGDLQSLRSWKKLLKKTPLLIIFLL